MKRLIPLFFGIIVLIIVNVSAFNRESELKHGTKMFVELLPVDPRSLIQGDYMVLRYDLRDVKGLEKGQDAANKQLRIVKLDKDSLLISSDLFTGQLLTDNQHLLKVKRGSSWRDFYPSSDTFLFSEGLAYCYEQAKYAELRVTPQGKALLYKLADKDLISLDCHPKQES